MTAPSKYIAPDDPAWDSVWVDELTELQEAGSGGAATHAMARYYSGETRFDLNAAGDDDRTPASYLREGESPVLFSLRRLRMTELTKCRSLDGDAGAELAFRLSCVGIDNGPSGMSFNPPKPGRLMSDATLQEVADYLGAERIYAAGHAALKASRAPLYAEKKPSG
ncbi:MAG: hypothetical protein AAF721_00435 [Myxococcota bacterium]